jgi:uncharacterized membrane protein
VVHFPLAFLPGAAFFYILAWLTGREPLAWTGLWLLVLGTVTAAVAASAGLYAEDGVMDVGARDRMCGAAHVGVPSAVLHGG